MEFLNSGISFTSAQEILRREQRITLTTIHGEVVAFRPHQQLHISERGDSTCPGSVKIISSKGMLVKDAEYAATLHFVKAGTPAEISGISIFGPQNI